MSLKRCRGGILLLAFSSVASGHAVSLGVTAGGALTSEFDSTEQTRQYTGKARPLLLGPTIRLRTHSGFGFELGALHKRFGYSYRPRRPLGFGYRESDAMGETWQLPFLAQYGRRIRRVRPFGSGGVSVRRVTSGREAGTSCAVLPSTVCRPIGPELTTLTRRTTVGAIAGGGLEFSLMRLLFSPEVRYTRWRSTTFADAVGSIGSLNQVELLFRLAFVFRR
jgi:hypothetical protein